MMTKLDEKRKDNTINNMNKERLTVGVGFRLSDGAELSDGAIDGERLLEGSRL